jgi:hypothetical protein
MQELYPGACRVAGASSSRPATSYGNAPAMATSVSVSGMRHREVPQIYSAGTSRAPRADPTYRPSSPPSGPVLSSWAAPDLSSPSMNSLGLSASRQDANGANSQTQPTARDSVSSWGTEDTHGDLFSTLRPLASAPADSGLPASDDLLPRSDGQLLGVVRAHFSSSSPRATGCLLFSQGRSTQNASPRPQFPQVQTQSTAIGTLPDRDTDSRPRSRSQTSHISNRDLSQSISSQSYIPEDRGYPYAPPLPSAPSIPIPYVPPRSTTPASLPQPYAVNRPPFPQIPAPQPTTAVSRSSQIIHQPTFYGGSTSQSQNSSHRTHHQHVLS